MSRDEREAFLAALVESGYLTPVRVEGDRALHYVPTDRLAWLEIVEAGGVPAEWAPVGPDTSEEAVLLSPFEFVTRGPRSVFEVDLVFEAYKPAAKRQYGYYTMPILHGDQLVARLDAKRDGDVLRVNGL